MEDAADIAWQGQPYGSDAGWSPSEVPLCGWSSQLTGFLTIDVIAEEGQQDKIYTLSNYTPTTWLAPALSSLAHCNSTAPFL